MLYLTQFISLILIALINGDVDEDCPTEINDLELDPPELVLQYGDPVSVSCSSHSLFINLFWSVPLGNTSHPDNQTVNWETGNLNVWEAHPVCSMNLNGTTCRKPLPVKVYKLPDNVSISTVDHTGPMSSYVEYKLQCDIQNVAPRHLLTVSWYKGDHLVESVSFTNISNKIPGNVSTILWIHPSEDDDGKQYKCEAKLNLGAEGPQPPLTVISDPLDIIISENLSQCSDLEVNPPGMVIQFGEPASVSCHSSSNYTYLGWTGPQENDSIPENQTIAWKTDNVSDWEIQPVCHRIADVTCKKPFNLIIYKLPDQVTISVVNHTGPMIEGKKYELQCDIQNFAPVNLLSVSWHKGTQLVKNRGFSDLPTKAPSNKTVLLKITAGKDAGEAPYTCTAKLKLRADGTQPNPEKKSNSLTVEVRYKPVLNCSNWSALLNTSLNEYPYTVLGNPSPSITWYQNKTNVNPDMLLSKDDSGWYELMASNAMGKTSCVAYITVEYAPIFKCPESYEAREHESFDNCSVIASPKATITWNKDRKTVGPVQNLTRGDNGSYVITAVNKHGITHHHLSIYVLYGPKIQPGNSEVMVEADEDVSLNCSAEGNPEPEVQWTFQNQIKATGRRQTTLTIYRASFFDEDSYTCTATNYLGIDTRTVSLIVKGSSPIILEPVELVVEFNTSALAICSTKARHNGLGWEAPQGAVDMKKEVKEIKWSVPHIQYWDLQPMCYINTVRSGQYTRRLPITVYKRPDQVSVSFLNHMGPMIEDRNYTLLCEVHEVAPVNLLIVNWYKGKDLLKTERFPEDTKLPVNKNLTLQITALGDNDGDHYKCEAELHLGPEGPQPRLKVASDPLNITVHYAPKIKQGKSMTEVNAGGKVSLTCNAEGNPKPEVSWIFRNKTKISGRGQQTLTISKIKADEAGEYICTAANEFATDRWTVSLVVQESNSRTILITLGIILAILIIVGYLIYLKVKRNRTGRYNIAANGTVSMSLLNQNEENGTTTSIENADK